MAFTFLDKKKEPSKNGVSSGYPTMSITETIINGFFTVDHRWTVLSWNTAAERLLGVDAKHMVGKNIWEQFAGIIPLNFYTSYQNAFLYDIPVHFEEYWAEKGCWFDVVTCHTGNVLAVSFKSCSEPSYPAPPQQQLTILNELYRYVTEVTNDCLWEWNINEKEIFWIDGGHKRLFGYDVQNALIPQSFWESCLHPDDKEDVLKSISQVIAGGKDCIWEIEYRFKKADGKYAYVHDRGHILFNEETGTCRMIGATQDITTRKLTEFRLRESERKLSLITKQTINAIIITDIDDNITWVNQAFTDITEYGSAEVIGKKPSNFLYGDKTDPSTIDYLQEKIKNKQDFNCDIIHYSKSGHQHCMRIHGQPLKDKDGNYEGYFSIETDITEIVQIENKLVEARQTKQKEITNAVLTAHENERAIIATELHDNLNQILAAAKLYIQMASTYEDKRMEYLDKSSGYIRDVINEIRKISKSFVIPGLHGTDLAESIENILDDIRLRNPMKIEFNMTGCNENDLSKKLQLTVFRIVQEQLSNIIKHADATKASIKLVCLENKLILSVADNGKGLEVLNENNGVGIINIISRAELHGGKVIIVTKPGKGYELKAIFPLNEKYNQGTLEL